MKKVLVPTDFSSAAWHASLFATEMATCLVEQPAPVAHHLATDATGFKDPLEFSFDEPGHDQLWNKVELNFLYAQESEADEREQLRDWADNINESTNHSLSVTSKAITGKESPHKKITEAAKTLHADLVVMGAQGAGTNLLSRKLLGTTAADAVKNCTKPVLLVPTKHKFRTPHRIVFAIDYNHVFRQEDLQFLAGLVKTFGATLTLLHVYSGLHHEEAAAIPMELVRMLQELEEQGFKTRTDVIQHHDVAAGIENYIELEQADWLVMIPRWHSLLDRMYKKSNTTQLMFETNIPLLTFPIS